MAGGSSTTSSQFPTMTTCTSVTPGLFTSTNWSTGMGQSPGTSPPPKQSPTYPLRMDSSLSFPPSTASANPSTETSVGPLVTKPAKSLNVVAIAVGVTGAALLLIVCMVVAFKLWKRKQKNKVPPSAEFMDLAVPWHPKSYDKTAESITSSVFIPKDGISLTSPPYESTKYNIPV